MLQGMKQPLSYEIIKHDLLWIGHSATAHLVSSAAAVVDCCLRWMRNEDHDLTPLGKCLLCVL